MVPRELLFLLNDCIVSFRIHHGRITSNEMMVDVIDELRSNAKDAVNQLKVYSYYLFKLV